MIDRFDRFTERARKVLSLAHEEAQRFNHNYIETEHLLLGLVREGDGVAVKVLSNLGVELITVRTAVETIIGRGDRIVLDEVGLTPRSKKVVELAVDEARRMNHHYIGTEHLLLGLSRAGEGIAGGVLASLGVNLEKVRTQTIAVLSQSGSHSAPAPDATQRSAGAPWQRAAGHDSDRFDTFTESARSMLSLAQDEAQRFQHNYIGTEHLLLGLLRQDESVAGRVLTNLGVGLDKVRSGVEFIIGRGDRVVLGEIGLTPRAKKVIELAVDEARRLNRRSVGTGDLLLGLVREGEGIAAGMLESLGVQLERARQETERVLAESHGQADDRLDEPPTQA